MVRPLITPTDERNEPLKVGGLSITVLASRSDAGNYEIFHMIGKRHTGPGPHYQPWDESLYVTKGELHCGVGDEEFVAYQGAFVHIPAGTVHWFKFEEDGGEIINMTSDGNASEMFKAFSQGINWESPDRDALIELAARYEQTIID